MPISDEDVREILRIIDESDLAELRIDTEGFSLHVRKGPPGAVDPGPPTGSRTESVPGPPGARGGPESTTPATTTDEPRPPAPTDAPRGSSAGLGKPSQRDGLATIAAPMLGTFYRAEAPGKPPFVQVGERVEPDTIVCIIEVMKMMNSVPAGVAGMIAEVVADNAELVEYGEPLFRVDPA